VPAKALRPKGSKGKIHSGDAAERGLPAVRAPKYDLKL
jgi:hypothetical protein